MRNYKEDVRRIQRGCNEDVRRMQHAVINTQPLTRTQ